MNQLANSLLVFDSFELAQPLPNRDAAALIQDYRNHGGWDHGQTKSVFFTRQEMNDFMTMMQRPGVGGVNVYFGRYPNDGSQNPAGLDYTGRTTVVFVLTRGTKNSDMFNVETPLPQIPPAPATITFDHGELNP